MSNDRLAHKSYLRDLLLVLRDASLNPYNLRYVEFNTKQSTYHQ